MTLFNTSQFAPFINGSYGISVLFLIGVSILTFTRYRAATKRLEQAETAKP